MEQLARDFGDNRRTRIDQAAEEINAFFDNPLVLVFFEVMVGGGLLAIGGALGCRAIRCWAL